ncbi:FKBP-type peptidyl-prolyl cis-trans isomerase [Myxococcaceae bacterium GXIMD 01537]
MRKTLLVAVMLVAAGCQKPAASTPAAANPQTEEQKTLYALGLSIGRSISVFNLTDEELAMVHSGIVAQVKGEKPLVELEAYGPKFRQLATERGQAKAKAEKAKAQAFLDEAAKESGAEKAASGLIYKELQAGTGESPKPTDFVKVHYKGTLTDGTEFDSSYKRKEPTQFPLNGVIPCWTEGVQKMKVGGKAKLVCPSDIAYGDRGSPPTIPGGAALIFEVELLEVVKAPEMPVMPAAGVDPHDHGHEAKPAAGGKAAEPMKK